MERRRVVVIGDRYTVDLFRIIGIEGVVVEERDPERVRAVLESYVNAGDIGIIYVTREIADLVRDYIDRVSITKRLPIITTIPSRWSEVEEIDISSMLRKALGVG